MELNNKKVLMMGLGLLGGGVATARFLVEQGAVLTITDMKSEEQLKNSIENLKDIKSKINFVLGEHRESDFLDNEIIVLNPDVSIHNQFVELAIQNGKMIENELTLFYKFNKAQKNIAITGTRGKTTTVNWTSHLLNTSKTKSIVVGNSPDSTFLGSFHKYNLNDFVVLEEPSFQLEVLGNSNFSSKIAMITNLYRDHINRHKNMEEYALAKANIFKNQTENDFLILNKDNDWTTFFLNLKPKSKIFFVSTFFTDIENGIFLDLNLDIIFVENKEKTILFNAKDFILDWGKHNLYNLMFAVLNAILCKIKISEIKENIKTLPQIKFRQEKIFEYKNIVIYNDTTATSPDGAMAALDRFSQNTNNLILITGGTDRELDFKDYTYYLKTKFNLSNLILLSGSATLKIKEELNLERYNEFDNLNDCVNFSLSLINKDEKNIILFSPASKSFEKFKNEYDRGEQFNNIILNLDIAKKINYDNL